MSEETSQSKPGGNTKPPGPKNQLYRWCFTINNPDEPDKPEKFANLLKIYAKEFYFQLEKGDSGTLHYQGVLSLKTKEYFNTVKNILGDKAHIEQCRNWFASINYTNKTETRVAGPWNHDTVWIDVIQNLYEWQINCLKILTSKPDNRTIYWVMDEEGNKGKTSFCKYMAIKHGATILNNGALKDLAFCLPDQPKMVLFNLTRSNESHINYTAIEAIKDGMILSSKYESKMKLFNSPHVMIFSNSEPNYNAMSQDRWHVITL